MISAAAVCVIRFVLFRLALTNEVWFSKARSEDVPRESPGTEGEKRDEHDVV